MRDRLDQGKEYIETGYFYRSDQAFSGTTLASQYPNYLHSCGPSEDQTPTRQLGCTPDLGQGSPFGVAGSPGFPPNQASQSVHHT